MNLTYAVRDGIISHCGEIDENCIKPRNGYIDLNNYTYPNQYSPYTWEGCVVKISDKISYIIRDIEDAIYLHIIDNHLDELYDLLKYDRAQKINNSNIINTLKESISSIDKIRDTSTSHERCSIIEVMGRNAGYIALWCGIANGAEDILLPERYNGDEQAIINHIIDGRKKGKKHHLIINAEGIGHSTGMARRIEAATGIETRATILGYMQRGGSPTCKDRMYASIMGSYAVDLLVAGKSNRLVAYKDGRFVDYDIDEALAMTKDISDYEFNISAMLSN